MDKFDVLERQYNAFIATEAPKDFFLSLVDYLEFIDAVPDFEHITAAIYAERDGFQGNLTNLEKRALEKIAKIQNVLSAYIKQKKINNEAIKEVLRIYDDWLTGKTSGSSDLPDALHDQIREIIKQLYALPKHKKYASKFIKFSDNDAEVIEKYAPIAEYEDFREMKEELESKRKLELWGQLTELSWIYDVIKRGREKHKTMVEQYKKTHSAKMAFDILNYKILLGEWLAIENDRIKDLFFFDVKKVRSYVTRLHNRILASSVIGTSTAEAKSKTLTETSNKEIPTSFQPQLKIERGIGYLQVFKQGRKLPIGRVETRKFKLAKCLFSPEGLIDTPYNPVFQKYERVFDAIRLEKDKFNNKLKDMTTMKTEICSIIENTIKEFQKAKTLRGYLRFMWQRDLLLMEIILPEGKLNTP